MACNREPVPLGWVSAQRDTQNIRDYFFAAAYIHDFATIHLQSSFRVAVAFQESSQSKILAIVLKKRNSHLKTVRFRFVLRVLSLSNFGKSSSSKVNPTISFTSYVEPSTEESNGRRAVHCQVTIDRRSSVNSDFAWFLGKIFCPHYVLEGNHLLEGGAFSVSSISSQWHASGNFNLHLHRMIYWVDADGREAKRCKPAECSRNKEVRRRRWRAEKTVFDSGLSGNEVQAAQEHQQKPNETHSSTAPSPKPNSTSKSTALTPPTTSSTTHPADHHNEHRHELPNQTSTRALIPASPTKCARATPAPTADAHERSAPCRDERKRRPLGLPEDADPVERADTIGGTDKNHGKDTGDRSREEVYKNGSENKASKS
ncbi:hypothetical protein R3P38DRAFT_3594110 [Favolaschia claudopus]|uniref:Uncharacterized protein n=1 Tax=Favolaschia claudopus TaxID=2862362 RepID=A0AAW0DKU5_9AGAR